MKKLTSNDLTEAKMNRNLLAYTNLLILILLCFAVWNTNGISTREMLLFAIFFILNVLIFSILEPGIKDIEFRLTLQQKEQEHLDRMTHSCILLGITLPQFKQMQERIINPKPDPTVNN